MTTTESTPRDAGESRAGSVAADSAHSVPLRRWHVPAYVGLVIVTMIAAIGPSSLAWSGAFVAFDSGHRWTSFPPGDHIQIAYGLWLWQDSLLSWGHAPWTDPYLFGAGGGPVTVIFGWPLVLATLPVSLLWGPVAAYNVCVYLGFVLAAVCTAAWVRALGMSPLAAGVAGLAYACAPFRFMQGIGHATAILAWMFPLLALCLERALRGDERHASLWGWGAAVTSVSIILSGEMHHAVFVILFAGTYVLVRLYRIPMRRVRDLLVPGAVAVVGSAAGGLALYFSLIRPSTARGGRSMEEAALYAPRPHEFLSTTAGNFERYAYMGRAILVLALIAVVAAFWKRRPSLVAVLTVATLGCAWLATAASFTSHPWIQATYRLVPFLSFSRVPGRLMVVGALLLAALAGLGVDWLGRRGRPWVLLPIAALFVIDLPAPYGNAGAGGNPYEGLADNAAILELPVYDADNAGASVYSMFVARHPGPRVGGYYVIVPADRDGARQQAMALQDDLADACSWESLVRQTGVDYVAVHRDRYGESISQRADDPQRVVDVLSATPGLQQARTREAVTVFTVDPSAFACGADTSR